MRLAHIYSLLFIFSAAASCGIKREGRKAREADGTGEWMEGLEVWPSSLGKRRSSESSQ